MNPALRTYIPIVNLIADTFGPCCEVVLHDLSMPEHSVVYTRNNQVTNRAVGQSFDHLIKDVLLSRDFRDDCTANYMTQDAGGRQIKSSTAILRDEKKRAIGALCVNMDVSAVGSAMTLLQGLLGVPAAENGASEPVEAMQNVQEIVDDMIRTVIGGYDPAGMSREEKVSVIRFMYEKGIFSIKGSVEKVAEQLGVSKVTVYSYLDEVKK